MEHYNKSTKQAIADLRSSESGLSSTEAKARLSSHGANKLSEGKKIGIVRRFINQLIDPMLIVLIIAAVVSLIVAIVDGEGFAEVIIISVVVLLNAVMGVVQECKADNAIKALSEMTAATSKVMRDGEQKTVRSEELTIGDVVVLEAGDAVPADMRLIETASMKVEESALTGESLPVDKNTDALKGVVTPQDNKCMAYSGTSVVFGRGKGIVTAVGMSTEMGKIASMLQSAKEEKTPLQRKLGQLSKILTFIVLGICAVVFAVRLFTAEAITHSIVLDSFIIAVSLAVAAIPEGLASVVTLTLSIGVTRMSKKNAIIRRRSAVETLGCAQIICSDKTGTLTQNRMTVVETYGEDESLLVKALALASDAQVTEEGVVGEPTERALVEYALKSGLNKTEAERSYPRVSELPFDSERKMMTTAHDYGDKVISYTKGAPDEVLKVCANMRVDGKVVVLTDKMRADILAQNKRMADKALRVLAGAYRECDKEGFAVNESELTFIGLVGMIDPVRPETLDAVAECKRAGIRPIMITGDHLDTAVAIALELGIITDRSQAITGEEMSKIPDDEINERITEFSVYARVRPEHKVRIVNAWKARGSVTAMTGDGVNDAPSIKSADIGIGMGITGTDVTKGVADMVLADDNFATIVTAVGEGRRIYDNILKAVSFLLSSNFAEVLAIFFATLLGFTILEPVHLLWINLIGDTVPAIALGMEKSDDDVMSRQPRSSNGNILCNFLGINIIVQGVFLAVITVLAYFIGHGIGAMQSGGEFVWEIPNGESAYGITSAFLTLAMAKMFHIFNARSNIKSIFSLRRQNVTALIAFFACTVLTVGV
ncbi:MAG: cation-translocating P-type ATPase, partial [Clostridia bacterium]|nr:cation-translocating P-type ATPase [Clostridia bacterium]